MKHVKATNVSSITGIKIKELGRIAMPGEEFDVSDSRYVVLSGNNMYHKVFVILCEEHKPLDEVLSVVNDEIQTKRGKRKRNG